jgi:hypothetical protein
MRVERQLYTAPAPYPPYPRGPSGGAHKTS